LISRVEIFFALNHHPASRNIPIDQLDVRGVNELSPDDTVIVYGQSERDGETAISFEVFKTMPDEVVKGLVRGPH
jgi:hypothetical protein